MKESDKCRNFFCGQDKAIRGQFPECSGCEFENVCQSLEDKAISLIFGLGLHEKVDDPLNVANIIDHFEEQGVDCETFKKRFTEMSQVLRIQGKLKEDKKFICSFVEVVHKFQAAKK